jgi:hypothetical protein
VERSIKEAVVLQQISDAGLGEGYGACGSALDGSKGVGGYETIFGEYNPLRLSLDGAAKCPGGISKLERM